MVKIITGLFFLNTLFQSNIEFCKMLYRAEGVENSCASLSNDGKKILYQSNSRGTWQLYLLDIATNQPTELTKGLHNNTFANWSLDNQWVTFVSDRDGNEEIYIMRSNGTEIKRLTTDAGRDIHPYFSPDGKSILFNSTRGNGSLDIYKYTLKTGLIERITATKEDEAYAQYSPDMKKIVYKKNNDKGDDIYVLNVTNKTTENLTNAPDLGNNWPVFTKNGEWIYFSSLKNGSFCIFKMKTDGSNISQITFPTDTNEEHARVFISQDDKTLIFNKKIGKTVEIWEYLIQS